MDQINNILIYFVSIKVYEKLFILIDRKESTKREFNKQ